MTRGIGTITGLILAALASFILWGAAHAQDYSLLEAANGGVVGVCTTQSGDKVKCVKFRPRETPAPTAQPTPGPTVAPLLCEAIGGVKTFVTGEPRMFCFTATGPPPAILEVTSTTPANVGCSDFESELTAPNGHKTYTSGAYPMGADFRMAGRYYLWVNPLRVGFGLCRNYTFTVK